MPFELLIARGNREGQQFVAVESVVHLGRGEENDVVLSDLGVSRQHTRIFEKEGRYWAEDLGSANGTLINGERVSAARALKTGDALAIGAALLNFVELDPPKVRSASGLSGEARSAQKPGSAPPPTLPGASIFDHERVTDAGEQDRWTDLSSLRPGPAAKKLFGEETEITAPVVKPAPIGDDSTVVESAPHFDAQSVAEAGPTSSSLRPQSQPSPANSLFTVELSSSGPRRRSG